MKLKWEWCDMCNYAILACPKNDCYGLTCNGGGCDWCHDRIHPPLEDFPTKEEVEAGVYRTVDD